jgi:hypothetical protein
VRIIYTRFTEILMYSLIQMPCLTDCLLSSNHISRIRLRFAADYSWKILICTATVVSTASLNYLIIPTNQKCTNYADVISRLKTHCNLILYINGSTLYSGQQLLNSSRLHSDVITILVTVRDVPSADWFLSRQIVSAIFDAFCRY